MFGARIHQWIHVRQTLNQTSCFPPCLPNIWENKLFVCPIYIHLHEKSETTRTKTIRKQIENSYSLSVLQRLNLLLELCCSVLCQAVILFAGRGL